MALKTFSEHLDALRVCIIKALLGLAVGVVASFVFISSIFKVLYRPYLNHIRTTGAPTGALLSLSPADTLQITLQAALLSGFCISLPWILYQLWKFVGPGLYKHEKKHITIFCSAGIGFFLIGLTLAYLFVLPTVIPFFYRYTTGMGITPAWTISNYFNFVTTFLMCFGLVFELPVAITVVSWLGIISSSQLSSHRRHAIVIIFIVAAILTPPDVISQIAMGIPMVILYELSIFASRLVEKKQPLF